MAAKTVIYQMLPRLWGDGTLQGVDDASLQYLKDLGVSHVWYTGIIKHSTGKPFVKGDPGSPYAISDWWDVNPYLSRDPSRRMEAMEDLIARTHSKGLKVILDFIPNHVGRDYTDQHGSIPLYDHYDYDWSDTLKINYSHPDTWSKMLGIVRFWASKGIDGLRCDMVELVDPAFFRWLIPQIKSERKDFLFVAEVYQTDNYRRYALEAGFDLLYDKSGLYDSLRNIVRGSSARELTTNWQRLGDLQPRMLDFLENHDEQRIASPWFTGRRDYFACVGASLLFNTASFMLYFGQEVGDSASEGHEGRTSIFNFTKSAPLQRLYAQIHERSEGLTDEELSTLRRYRELLGLARTPLFSEGGTFDLTYCQSGSERYFAFLRHLGPETALCFCNFSSERAAVEVNIPQHACDCLQRDLPRTISVNVGPYDVGILQL